MQQQQTINKNKKILHHFQNCTVRSILRAPRSEHVNPLSQKHHWLSIPACFVYIFHCLAFSALSVESCLPDFFFLIYSTLLDISMLKKVPSYWLSQNSATKLMAIPHPPTWLIPSLQTSLERREATISWFSHLRIVSLRTETPFYNRGEPAVVQPGEIFASIQMHGLSDHLRTGNGDLKQKVASLWIWRKMTILELDPGLHQYQ